MAKVSLIINDTDEDNGVNVRIEFDPPMTDEDDPTSAQAEAAFLIEVLQRRASGQTLDQMAEEMQDSDYGTIIENTLEIDEVVFDDEDEDDVEPEDDEEIVH